MDVPAEYQTSSTEDVYARSDFPHVIHLHSPAIDGASVMTGTFSIGTSLRCVMNDVPTHDDLAHTMVTLIASVAKVLVDLPNEVSVQAVPEQGTTVLHLKVAPVDLGKIIGKQGRTARSIRTILGAASMKAQHRFSLDIQRGDPDAQAMQMEHSEAD